MNVREVMTRDVRTCTRNTPLDAVAKEMWEHDFGCMPVVDSEGRAVAMITDRDVCMAAYTQGLPLGKIFVGSAASRGIVSLREDASLEAAEELMRTNKVRRIPIVDSEGRPVGMVSMNDLARRANGKKRRAGGLDPENIVRTLAAVCEPAARRNSIG